MLKINFIAEKFAKTEINEYLCLVKFEYLKQRR